MDSRSAVITSISKTFKTPLLWKEGLSVICVKNQHPGIEIAKSVLYTLSDKKTVLFLSGGKTPRELYQILAQEKKIEAGAAALVDERFGSPLHEDSNEKIIKKSGLLDYFLKQNIQFYPILKNSSCHSELVSESQAQENRSRNKFGMTKDRKETAIDYDETVRYLLAHFRNSVAVLGVGIDGHTAGISVQNKVDTKELFVSNYDFSKEPKERISMTLKALSMIDVLLVLVFGKEKKKALKLLFSEGSVDEIPSRFFLKEEIAKKTLLITDQKV